MAEQQNGNTNQLDILKKLAAIGSDLWGSPDDTDGHDEPADAEKKTAFQPAPRRKENGISSLWKTADETVDWTDALAHDIPRDGLTGRRLWSFYHKMAEKVLAGDLEAYTEVLKTSNPLGELTEYAEGINIRAPSSDRLESSFICRDELMNENRKLYLAGMGLRIARDLLACLPVNEVKVTAVQDGKTVFSAAYPRQQLLHRNFAFIDPVKFAEECGAEFA